LFPLGIVYVTWYTFTGKPPVSNSSCLIQAVRCISRTYSQSYSLFVGICSSHVIASSLFIKYY
jgi:hypothetical protein